MILLIYSNYSQPCKQFIENLKSAPPDLHIQTLCIDNKKAKNRVLRDDRFSIKSVPCILIFYANSNVDKFEGIDAFQWQTEIIENYQETLTSDVNYQEDMIEDEEELIEEKPVRSEKKKTKKTKKKDKEVTMIVDLKEENTDDDTDDEFSVKEEYVPQSLKKTSMNRVDSGNYEISNFDDEDSPIISTNKGIKKTGGSDILSIAQAMQKDREK